MEETVAINEPVVESNVEEPTVEETVEPVNEGTIETPEIEEQEEEKIEPPKEFNPEEMDFGEDIEGEEVGEHMFGDYNLDKYAENFDGFQDEGLRDAINEEAVKLKELGFTQAQAEFYLERQMDKVEEQAPKAKTVEEIQEGLKNGLTNEEKRYYKTINKGLAESIKGTELEPMGKAIMQNPNLVKLVYLLQKGNTQQFKKAYEKSSVKPTTEEDISDTYVEKVLSVDRLTPELKQEIISDIISKSTDKKMATQILSKYL